MDFFPITSWVFLFITIAKHWFCQCTPSLRRLPPDRLPEPVERLAPPGRRLAADREPLPSRQARREVGRDGRRPQQPGVPRKRQKSGRVDLGGRPPMKNSVSVQFPALN
jgi:hypothetical protein